MSDMKTNKPITQINQNDLRAIANGNKVAPVAQGDQNSIILLPASAIQSLGGGNELRRIDLNAYRANASLLHRSEEALIIMGEGGNDILSMTVGSYIEHKNQGRFPDLALDTERKFYIGQQPAATHERKPARRKTKSSDDIVYPELKGLEKISASLQGRRLRHTLEELAHSGETVVIMSNLKFIGVLIENNEQNRELLFKLGINIETVNAVDFGSRKKEIVADTAKALKYKEKPRADAIYVHPATFINIEELKKGNQPKVDVKETIDATTASSDFKQRLVQAFIIAQENGFAAFSAPSQELEVGIVVSGESQEGVDRLKEAYETHAEQINGVPFKNQGETMRLQPKRNLPGSWEILGDELFQLFSQARSGKGIADTSREEDQRIVLMTHPSRQVIQQTWRSSQSTETKPENAHI
ncbi:MAG: hypothetical protein KDI46_05990 [Alphaproteobacteria bacterium]|nr:hypothetical protein [Alphaproteobacteria bacterium]